MPFVNIDRLASIAQMLASPVEQERATAARIATDMLTLAGTSWETVIRHAFAERHQLQESARQEYEAKREAEAQDVERERYSRWRKANPKYKVWNGVKAHDLIEALTSLPRNLTDWEKSFVLDMRRKKCGATGLTEKQWVVLWQLGLKARVVKKAS